MLKNDIEITRDCTEFEKLSDKYDIPVEEIRYIDLNRTGLYLPKGEIPISFRARFLTSVTSFGKSRDTYFALPVRTKEDTNYSIFLDDTLRFNEDIIGPTKELELDTCDMSYSRGPNLLNLNSRRRGNCGGCQACVHNYKKLYDERVLKDTESLISKEDIKYFFDKLEEDFGYNVNKLKQIAVVTGLFGSEEAVVEHMSFIYDVVKERDFNGELLYFGCEVNSKEALKKLSRLGNFALIYAIDNFTQRDKILNKTKSNITLEDAEKTMKSAKDFDMEVTYAYIAGIDPLDSMMNETEKLKKAITRFPVINIYQVQHPNQIRIMNSEAKKLDYYTQARKNIEEIFSDTDMKPRTWENYRPLWYDEIYGEPLI